MSRTHRSALTLATGVAGQALVVVVGFVTTPLQLRYVGKERFGAFRAATDWFGYVGLLEFGVGGALIALFTHALGNENRAGVLSGIRAGMRAYCLLAGLSMAVAAILAMAMPRLIGLPDYLRSEFWAGCWLYVVSILLLPMAVFRPLAEAEQRGYLVSWLNTAQLVIAMTTSVAFAAAGWGLVGLFLAVFVGGAFFHLTLAWVELRRYPELLGRAAPLPLPTLWGLSWPNLLFNLASRVGLLTDNILVAAFLGPAAVTPFVLTQRMIQMASAQVTLIGIAGWAGLMELHYRGEHAVFGRRLAQLTRLTSVAGGALLLPIAVCNRELVRLWVGEQNYAGPAVTWLAFVNAWYLAVLSLWGWPLMAGGKVRAVLPCILTSVGVNLAVSIAGAYMVGLPGPLLGTTAALWSVSGWWTLLLVRREFEVAPSELVRAAVRPALVAVPYAVSLMLLADAVPAYGTDWSRWAGLLALAAWMATAAGGYCVLAWFLAFPAADRAEWVGLFRGWIRRKPRGAE